jgi:hypothetical protein
VDAAAKKCAQVHANCLKDLSKAREEATAQVADVQRDLDDRRQIAWGSLENETVCAAQARRVASTLVEQEEVSRLSSLRTLDAQLSFAASQAQRKGANFAEEITIAEERNVAKEGRANSLTASAEVRSIEEAKKANARVEDARAAVADLHAQCAAYIRGLEKQLEEAKAADTAKVAAAAARRETLKRFCTQKLEECKQLWDQRLGKAKQFQQERKDALQDKVNDMRHHSEYCVNLQQRMAQERRSHAQRLLSDFKFVVEDVRMKCRERSRVEAETSAEKVHIARERCDDRRSVAARRQADAEAMRDKARVEHAAAFARLRGAAAEVRRRGLEDIATILEQLEHSSDATGVAPTASHCTESDAQQAEAATKIQSIHRGKQARRDISNRKEVLESSPSPAKAAQVAAPEVQDTHTLQPGLAGEDAAKDGLSSTFAATGTTGLATTATEEMRMEEDARDDDPPARNIGGVAIE